MRKLILVAVIIVSVFLIGCSVSTDLAVINLSDRPVEIKYRFKEFPGGFYPQKPATKAHAEIDRDYAWRELPVEQYLVDSESRTITVTLAPKTALLVGRFNGLGIPTADQFALSEIVMRGAYGTVILHGEQLRKSFAEEVTQVSSIKYK